MCVIRPDAETMNQTLRPLGTYASDAPHAQKTGNHIPHMVLGPERMYWHPDVRLSEQSWATATQVSPLSHTQHSVWGAGRALQWSA